MAGKSTAARLFVVWFVLQAGGLLTLLAGFGILAAIDALSGVGDSLDRFLSRWGTAFVLVPVTFVPVLVLWHRWALQRYGRRPGLFRLAAELAFAAELVGCVLYQRLA